MDEVLEDLFIARLLALVQGAVHGGCGSQTRDKQRKQDTAGESPSRVRELEGEGEGEGGCRLTSLLGIRQCDQVAGKRESLYEEMNLNAELKEVVWSKATASGRECRWSCRLRLASGQAVPRDLFRRLALGLGWPGAGLVNYWGYWTG